MLKFSVKLLLLVSTLLFGILLGIQQAEQGIFSLEGLPQTERQSFFIKKIDEDQVEVAFLGESFSINTLEEKEKLWQERHHHNTWSQLGHTLGDAVYSFSRKTVVWLINQFDKVI